MALTLAVPATACPLGIGTINSAWLAITPIGDYTYGATLNQILPKPATKAATVTMTQAVGIGRVNGRTGRPARGSATSATLLLGLVANADEEPVHGFYIVLGTTRDGQDVPAKTYTFHSLEPGTKYTAMVFATDVQGETNQQLILPPNN